MMRGTVSAFDGACGLGTVTGEDGDPYLFHAIEIADGTRSIDVGRTVCFVRLARFGQIQAASIHPA